MIRLQTHANGRFFRHIYWLAMCAVAVPSPAASELSADGPDVDACHKPSYDRIAEEGLPPDGKGVMYRVRDLEARGTAYKIETFSAWSDMPGTRANVCLRYEVQNSSDMLITDFKWELLGAHVREFEAGPGNRRARVWEKPTTREPIASTTTLYALENSKVTSKAWQRYEQITASLVDLDETNEFRLQLVNVAVDFPEIDSIAQEFNLPRDAIFGYRAPSFPLALEIIEQSYTSPNFTLATLSYVKYDNGYHFYSSVQIDTPDIRGIDILAPFFDAHARWEEPDRFVKSVIERLKRELVVEEGKYHQDVFLEALYYLEDNPAIFVVDHPVFISGETWSECVLMTSYSRIPISFGLEQC